MPATRVTVSELRALHEASARLDLRLGGLMDSLFPGARRARYRGRGIEFDEVRPYQRGDDFRAIDWRVTARTGSLYTRLFHEERERTLWLVCDGGPAMWFGTRNCFKWVLAARVAALVAWAARDAGERVGAVFHGDGRHCRRLPALAGDAGLNALFHRLAAAHRPEGDGACGLVGAVRHLQRLTRPGALVLFLGGFHVWPEGLDQALARLARHRVLGAVWVHDPLERTLPRGGPLPVDDGAGCRGWLECDAPELRRRWRAAFEARRERVRRGFERLGGRMLELGTDEPLTSALEQRLR